MELLYDSVCEFRDKTAEFLNNINIAIVTDTMIDNYKNGIEYDFSEYGFDSSVAEKIWLTSMYPYNSYVENAIKEILHNCINIQTDGQLERYLNHSIERFKQIKARVDHKLYVEKSLAVYDYTSTIPHQGSPIVLTRDRKASKVEQIFDFVQCYSSMIQSVINLMEGKLPNRPEIIKIVPPTGEERYFLDLSKINQSYLDFKTTLFADGYSYKDYLSCFDLNNVPSRHPVFRRGKQSDFVYFLSKIEYLKVNDKIAEDQFGIKKYRQQVSNMANRTTVFSNQVEAILNKR